MEEIKYKINLPLTSFSIFVINDKKIFKNQPTEYIVLVYVPYWIS